MRISSNPHFPHLDLCFWFFLGKLADHFQPFFLIALIHRARDLSERQKFKKMRRRLDRVGEIDENYCNTFDSLSDDFPPVIDALDALAKFLDSVCKEGNLLSGGGPPAESPPATTTTITTTTVETDKTKITSNPSTIPFAPPGYPSTASRPSPLSTSSSPRAQRPPIGTPSWKIALSDRFPLKSLSVSVQEVQVFANVREKMVEAKESVEEARNQCLDRSQLASDMQRVYDEWCVKCDDWKVEARRRVVPDGSGGEGEKRKGRGRLKGILKRTKKSPGLRGVK